MTLLVVAWGVGSVEPTLAAPVIMCLEVGCRLAGFDRVIVAAEKRGACVRACVEGWMWRVQHHHLVFDCIGYGAMLVRLAVVHTTTICMPFDA